MSINTMMVVITVGPLVMLGIGLFLMRPKRA